MKAAPIVPFSLMDYLKANDYHMILANLCSQERYRTFYKGAKGFKILDNGAAEGNLTYNKRLLELAYELDCEVVCPDTLSNPVATQLQFEYFLKAADSMGIDPPIMFPIQCKTWEEFDLALFAAAEIGTIGSFALPRVMCKWLGPYARLEGALRIRRLGWDLPIHCLGCSTDLVEIRALAAQGIVRGIDSAAPTVLAIQGHWLDSSEYNVGKSHSAVPDYFHFVVNEYQERLCDTNLKAFRDWAETPLSIMRELYPEYPIERYLLDDISRGG